MLRTGMRNEYSAGRRCLSASLSMASFWVPAAMAGGEAKQPSRRSVNPKSLSTRDAILIGPLEAAGVADDAIENDQRS